MITRDKVLAALSQVIEPDLGKDLVTLGMIENLQIENNDVSFTVMLTTPACPLKEQIKKACENAVIHLVDPAAKVKITMSSRVTSRRQNSDVLSGVRNIIAIASGKGGVGKSTVSVNLARALADEGARVGLLDADIYGPSIPTMFGINETPEMIEKDGRQLMKPVEKDNVRLLSIGFLLKPGQAVVWRGPMISSAVRQFMNDVEWGELDYLIVDLPPGTGDVHLTLAQQFPITGVVVVTTPQEVALTDARKAIAMFRMQGAEVPLLGVVENMSFFSPVDRPDKKYYLFGSKGGEKLAAETGLPLLAEIPLIEEIRQSGDAGLAYVQENSAYRDVFRNFASNVARAVALHNAGLPSDGDEKRKNADR